MKVGSLARGGERNLEIRSTRKPQNMAAGVPIVPYHLIAFMRRNALAFRPRNDACELKGVCFWETGCLVAMTVQRLRD